ncbi:Transcription factor WhiB [Micromonospora nigra]|uniref:Transcription factor WhiB n=1 Tax=Micromonospora nigra TaxID=145857 RepID=A0A1C6SR27_9ACTN|nr:WhiB family transcriptional regulator [Micromonospora nigra]SCL32064.1 Transcription factor WhiB [Micromonospora nigra]
MSKTGPVNVGEYPRWLDTATETPACRGEDTNLFFPAEGEQWKVPRARAICNRCPLFDTCRDWAMAQTAQHLAGIWGGTTFDQRRKLKAGTGSGNQPVQFRKTKPSTEGEQ